MTSYEHYKNALALRHRIVMGESNERPIMAWAAVCRACAAANFAHRRAMADSGQTFAHRSDLSFFNNLDAIWWYARAQVETLQRKAGVAE
jgi:hypothetical protein